MVLNLHSSSFGALDGGVGGGEALMVVMNMRCSRAAEWNVLKEMQDCAGRVQNWMSDFKVRWAGRAYIYNHKHKTRDFDWRSTVNTWAVHVT